MRSRFLRHLPGWAILAVLGTVSISFVLLYLFRNHTPHSPPALVLSVCGPVAPGMHRIDSDFGIQFDVSESVLAVHANTRDMPPGTLYVVTLKGSSENLVIWRDDNIFSELRSAFPVFSEHVEERDIRTPKCRLVGKDRWGYLKDGDQWRYVRFFVGDAVGYRPLPSKQAGLLDQVISSACVSPGRRDSSVQQHPPPRK